MGCVLPHDSEDCSVCEQANLLTIFGACLEEGHAPFASRHIDGHAFPSGPYVDCSVREQAYPSRATKASKGIRLLHARAGTPTPEYKGHVERMTAPRGSRRIGVSSRKMSGMRGCSIREQVNLIAARRPWLNVELLQSRAGKSGAKLSCHAAVSAVPIADRRPLPTDIPDGHHRGCSIREQANRGTGVRSFRIG